MPYDFDILKRALEDEENLPADELALTEAPEDPLELLKSVNSDPDVLEARQRRDERLASSGVAQGLAEIGAALASQGRVKAGTSAYEANQKVAEKGVEEAQKTATGKSKLVADFIKNQAARKKQEAADDKWERKFDQQDRLIKAMAGERERKHAEGKEKQLKDDVQDFGKAVSSAQEINKAIQALENEVGFKLDAADIDEANNKITVDGKSVDLPGVSLPLVGRVSGYSPKARTLQGTITNIFNKELKDKAGSTVTNTEMERLKTAWNSGMFNTESEMLKALKNYRAAAVTELQNREAQFDPAVKARYQQQGGETSESFAGVPKTPKPPITPEQARAELARRRAAKGN